jgi:hypothetical protein
MHIFIHTHTPVSPTRRMTVLQTPTHVYIHTCSSLSLPPSDTVVLRCTYNKTYIHKDTCVCACIPIRLHPSRKCVCVCVCVCVYSTCMRLKKCSQTHTQTRLHPNKKCVYMCVCVCAQHTYRLRSIRLHPNQKCVYVCVCVYAHAQYTYSLIPTRLHRSTKFF